MLNRVQMRSGVSAFIAAAAVAIAFNPSFAQNRAPSMFTVPKTGNPLGQQMFTPDGFVREDMLTPGPALRPEDAKYADLNGVHMKDMVKEIAGFSLKDRDSGNLFWGRNIGTLGHVLVEDWTIEKLKKAGLTDVHKEELTITEPQWSPKYYDLTFSGDGVPAKLVSARPSISNSTPPAGLDLELMWLGQGSEADFLGRDVKGKAVLIQDIPLPGDIRHSIQTEGTVKRAYDHGAAAVGIVFGVADNFSIWLRTEGKYGFNLGYNDGMKLRDALGAGKKVRVSYNLDAETKTNVKSSSVWGTLPGNTNEEILIVAHIDGYFEGALDNATGLAMMVNMAEHYAKIPQSQRRRTIKFLGSVGHHGGPGTRPVHEKQDWSKVAYILNLEHVAVLNTEYWGAETRLTTAPIPMRWSLNASPRVETLVQDNLKRFGVAIHADINSTVGEIGPIYPDAPSLTLISAPAMKHTEQDTPEWIPSTGLEMVGRAHTRIIDDLNKLDLKDILPTGKWPPGPPPGTNNYAG